MIPDTQEGGFDTVLNIFVMNIMTSPIMRHVIQPVADAFLCETTERINE